MTEAANPSLIGTPKLKGPDAEAYLRHVLSPIAAHPINPSPGRICSCRVAQGVFMRDYLPGHECQSARYAGFGGLKNGELLDAAEAAGFDILVTVARGFRHEQNLPAPGERTFDSSGRESLKNRLGLRLECRATVAMIVFRP